MFAGIECLMPQLLRVECSTSAEIEEVMDRDVPSRESVAAVLAVE